MKPIKALAMIALACPLLVGACERRGSKNPNLRVEGGNWPSLNQTPVAIANPALRDAAVVVAIEDYQNPQVDDIPGAKANGSDWVLYLHNTLGVPQANILLLANY